MLFHRSFGSWRAPGYSNRDLGANEDSYARAYMACVWAFRGINVFVQKIADVLRKGQVVNKATNPITTPTRTNLARPTRRSRNARNTVTSSHTARCRRSVAIIPTWRRQHAIGAPCRLGITRRGDGRSAA